MPITSNDLRMHLMSRRGALVVLALLVCATVLLSVHWMFGIPVLVLAFLVGRGPLTAPVLLSVAVALTVTGPWYKAMDPSDVETWISVTTSSGFQILAPWLIGRYVRDRHALKVARRRQAEQFEESRRTLTAEARLRERTLIAREIHDTVGHELSLIALRAGALEVGVGTDSASASDAARQLREAATRASEQLGDIVGLLGDGESAPLRPAHDDVADVIDRAADAGLDVTLTWNGTRASLSPLVRHTVIRVVQEALTNATKHAPGSPVAVTIATDADAVELEVLDEGSATDAPPRLLEGGRGLIGLMERVRLLGGTFAAEPTDEGFRVTSWIPRDGHVTRIDDEESRAYDRTTLDVVDETQSRARRSLLMAIGVPVAIVAVSTIATIGYFTFATISSVLTPDEFATIEVGQPREEVEEFLPPVEMLEPPTDRLDPPAGSDADCRYYESDVSFFARSDVYRVCFADDVVVAADVIAEPDS